MARAGVHASEITGRIPSQIGKIPAVVSSKTLRKLRRIDTAECQEVNQLLKKNSFRGRKPYKWNDAAEALVVSEIKTARSYDDVALMLQERLNLQLSAAQVANKVYKLGLAGSRARVFTSSQRRTRPMLPRLTGIIATPSHEVFTVIDECLPRWLDFHQRKEVMSEMMLAVLEGRLQLDEVSRRYREFLRTVNRMFPTKSAPPSLDAPLFADSTVTLGATITRGMWQ